MGLIVFRLPQRSLIPAWAVKVGISVSVIWSFVMANLNNPGALKLWLDGWEAILVYMGMGLGLSWVKDVAHRKVDCTDGGEKPQEEKP